MTCGSVDELRFKNYEPGVVAGAPGAWFEANLATNFATFFLVLPANYPRSSTLLYQMTSDLTLNSDLIRILHDVDQADA